MMGIGLRRMRDDEGGVSAVEFALVVPLLLALLMGTVTVFDLYRTAQAADKAAFAVGDMLSRQTSITDAKLLDMLRFARYTVNSADDAALRISSISNNSGSLVLDWSRRAGNALLTLDPIDYALIPDIAAGDSVIVTETFIPHSAFIAGFGVDDVVFRNVSIHRPRFVGRIAYN